MTNTNNENLVLNMVGTGSNLREISIHLDYINNLDKELCLESEATLTELITEAYPNLSVPESRIELATERFNDMLSIMMTTESLEEAILSILSGATSMRDLDFFRTNYLDMDSDRGFDATQLLVDISKLYETRMGDDMITYYEPIMITKFNLVLTDYIQITLNGGF